MKKRSDENFKEYICDDPEEIFKMIEVGRHSDKLLRSKAGDISLDTASKDTQTTAALKGFGFELSTLSLLKTANPLRQKYYYIENDEHYAFFTVYENRMNLFTFGKASWFMNIQTIAFPCSLSSPGFITDDMEWMLEYIKTIKGCKLVLNVTDKINVKGMSFGETLPTCILSLRKEHKDIDSFIDSLRAPYRRRINIALKKCAGIQTVLSTDDSTDVHPLYLQTYERSEYKLECLCRDFFDKTEGKKIIFLSDGKPVGFVLLRVNGEELVFMLCGMDYPKEKCKDRVLNADLYYYMLLTIVDYAIKHNCKTIDFGQTSEKTKLKFGAVLSKRYFYAHHSNPFLNLFAMTGKHMLEYKYDFPEFHVFKEQQ
ncbi:MAG: GNAT family N-acetyltransferase [Lachnospiraceae bacterium]|nr:GNAT family N-acetyltransferase [Lachnospiraceae bacterium]